MVRGNHVCKTKCGAHYIGINASYLNDFVNQLVIASFSSRLLYHRYLINQLVSFLPRLGQLASKGNWQWVK